MDDHSFLGIASRQEVFAYPAQIFRALIFQGNPGTNAGMHEDIIAFDDHVLERFKECTVRGRDRSLHHSRQFLVIGLRIGLRRDAIAQKRFPSADAVKEPQRSFLSRQCREEYFFMVAHQEPHARALFAQGHNALDHAGGIGPPVDQVTQKNQLSLPSAARLFITDNAVQQPLEKIETPMDIADRIDPAPLRDHGSGDNAFLSSKEEFRNHSRGARLLLMKLDWRFIGNSLHLATAKRRTETKPRHRAMHAFAAALLAVAMASPAEAAGDTAFEAVRAADTAIARIGYRLATANASLCDRLEPGLGLVLQTPGQYDISLRQEAMRHFHMDGPVGVEAALPGSPAAAAGIEANDTLLSVGTAQFAPADPDANASTQSLIEITAQIAALPADAPVEIHGRRNGKDYVRTVDPVPACRTRFEMLISQSYAAQSDGEMVQVSSRLFDDYPEDQTASVIAHEFAHNILHHRERMEEMGLSFGLLSGFGRNVRYFRETELQADILSVSLLANAGYDPEAAIRFWRAFGPSHASSILLSRSHPAWKDRVATMQKAIADLGPARPNHPAVLATLGKPLDGNWKALLVEAR